MEAVKVIWEAETGKRGDEGPRRRWNEEVALILKWKKLSQRWNKWRKIIASTPTLEEVAGK